MFVEEVSLLDYRNFNNLNIKLDKNINIFYGENAQGKTNFLESIYLCGIGRSHRTRFDKELIMIGKAEAHVRATVNNENIKDTIDVHLKVNEKKGIALNGLPIKKLKDLLGIMMIVIFSPEDLYLLKAGPAMRRRFMDIELCQLSSIYYFTLQQYYKVLRQRNNLLKSIQKKPNLKETLSVWDKQLVEYGIKIIEFRKDFIEKLNDISREIHKNITNKKEEFSVIYKPNVNIEDFENRLLKSIERDIFLGATSFGIHKDDLVVFINEMDVKTFGSQGQIRTSSLSLKLAEIQLIKEEKNTMPILLLDDVLSELDKTRQSFLLDNIKDIQTILTCTGVEDALTKIASKSSLYKVVDGNIHKE